MSGPCGRCEDSVKSDGSLVDALLTISELGLVLRPVRVKRAAERIDYETFVHTEMWLVESLVNEPLFQSLQRSRRVIPARRAMRSSSDGQT